MLVVVLLLAAALSRAAADYLMTSIYSDSTCSSTISPNRRSFSFAGGSCALISPGVWGGVSCVNPSVANQVLFSDAQCTVPFPPQPVADLGVCAPSGDGLSSNRTCVTGAFPEPGPQGGLVVSLYSSPAACPLTTQTREAVVWTAVDTCVRLSATTSAVFSCSATGASAQQWTNPTCSGAPSSTGSQQLGCSTPTGSSGAAFASCTFNPLYSVTIVNQTDDDTFCRTSCSTQPPAVGFGLPNNGVSVSFNGILRAVSALRLSLTPHPPHYIQFSFSSLQLRHDHSSQLPTFHLRVCRYFQGQTICVLTWLTMLLPTRNAKP